MMSAYEILHCIHVKTGKSMTQADVLFVCFILVVEVELYLATNYSVDWFLLLDI